MSNLEIEHPEKYEISRKDPLGQTRHLVQKLWDNREFIFLSGVILSTTLGAGLAIASHSGTTSVVFPELLDIGSKLSMFGVATGGIYMFSRIAIGFLEDIDKVVHH